LLELELQLAVKWSYYPIGKDPTIEPVFVQPNQTFSCDATGNNGFYPVGIYGKSMPNQVNFVYFLWII